MEIILLSLFVLLASILQGVTGFGFAIIAAPLILSLYDAQTTIVILTIISLTLNTYLSNKIKTNYNKDILVKLITFGAIGIPLGIFIISTISPNTLKITASVLSILFALFIYIPKTHIKENTILTYLTGLVTGILQSSVGISGPPVVLLLTSYKLNPIEMKKILALFFLFLSTISLPLFFYKNILNIDRFNIAILMVPIAITGGFIGNKLAKKIPSQKFRLIALALVIISSIQILITLK